MLKNGDIDQLERVFIYFDENGDGKISASELKNRVGLMGGEMLLREVEEAVESLDKNGDGLLDVEDFVGLMEGGSEEDKLQDLREAFCMYDVDDCGFIRPKDLKRMLSRLGESKSIDESFAIDGMSQQVLVTTTQEASLCTYADTHNSGDQETFFDSYPCLPLASDSEDDFRSVNTEFSRSFSSSPRHRFSFTCPSTLNKTITRNEADNNNSPVKQDKKLYQLFDDDPFWSDQVVNIKEIELVDFFQDSLSIHQLVLANHNALPSSPSSCENVCTQNSKGSGESDDHQNINSPCICIPISFLRVKRS
ncbi:hypothetical protein EZV62_023823 [Acer yangbiense]|uniref:EF-hand domain-containing protein n=1 Tax=Acer yangbiense TaxID=1000413 RepID=A0A5C7H3I9_9ROSI|nr:hypothetical protein EZV62_023823 [Acer yangbiense]